jgi:hypothetical protein
MKVFTTAVFLLLFLITNMDVKAQGCVAIRGFSSCSGSIGNNAFLMKGDLTIGANYRYFKSFRHFRGDHEETHRVEEGTEVINKSSLLDLSVNYGFSERLFGTLTVPFIFHDRSSMYEHGGNPPNGLGERHTTTSSGLSDVRLSAGYWLFNPDKHHNFNYAAGLGIKLPTGKYDYTDIFYNQGPERNQDIETVVDQSIQPGDGGFGITLEVQGYQTISHHLMLSTNLYYMLNPKTTNGVLTRSGNEEFSCPDQFAARLGVNYLGQGFSAYLGGRVEGVPSSDLIGSSAGYRRPGYVVSAEPGVSYSVKNILLSLNVPVALYRNRIQSYADKLRTAETGVYRIGDAAFANYLINFNVSYRINGKSHGAKTLPDIIDIE